VPYVKWRDLNKVIGLWRSQGFGCHFRVAKYRGDDAFFYAPKTVIASPVNVCKVCHHERGDWINWGGHMGSVADRNAQTLCALELP